MIEPKKILTNIDLSNNDLLQVSTIKGPDYDSSTLPRELNIEAPSKTNQPSTLNIKAPSVTGGFSKINISTDASNIITLDDNDKTFTQKSNNVNETINTQLDLNVATGELEVLSNNTGTNITSKTSLKETSSKKEIVVIDTESDTINKLTSNIKDLELNAGYTDKEINSKLKVTSTSLESSITANTLNIDDININKTTVFKNAVSNEVDVTKKLELYSPELTIKVGAVDYSTAKTSPSLTITAANGDNNSEILVDKETVDKTFISSESSTLKGTTNIQGNSLSSSLSVSTTSSSITSSQINIGNSSDAVSADTVNIKTKNININGTDDLHLEGLNVDLQSHKNPTENSFELKAIGTSADKSVLSWKDNTDTSLNVNSAAIDASTTLTGNVSATIKPVNSFSITTEKNTDSGEAKAGSITYSDRGLVIDESNTLHLNSANKTFALGSNTVKEYGAKNVVVARVDSNISKISADNIQSTTQLTANALEATGVVKLADPTITSGGITFNAVDPTISTAGKLTIKSTGSNTNGVLLQAEKNTDDKVEILANSSVAKLDNVTATKSLTSDTSSVLTGNHVSFNGTGLNVNAEVKNTGNLVDIKYIKTTESSSAPSNSEINIKVKSLNINNDTTTVNVGGIGDPVNKVNEYITNLNQEISTVDLHTKNFEEPPKDNPDYKNKLAINSNVVAGNTTRSEIKASYMKNNNMESTNSVKIGNSLFEWDSNSKSLVISIL